MRALFLLPVPQSTKNNPGDKSHVNELNQPIQTPNLKAIQLLWKTEASFVRQHPILTSKLLHKVKECTFPHYLAPFKFRNDLSQKEIVQELCESPPRQVRTAREGSTA